MVYPKLENYPTTSLQNDLRQLATYKPKPHWVMDTSNTNIILSGSELFWGRIHWRRQYKTPHQHIKTILQCREKLGWKNFLNIDLDWDYKRHMCMLSIKNYIEEVRVRYRHKTPSNLQYVPHKHIPPTYRAKTQLVNPQDTSELVPEDKVKWVQGVVRALLVYGRVVDNKVLVALGTLATQALKAMVNTVKAVHQLLDYVCTYPNDGIICWASGMQLVAHSDAEYLNERKGRLRARSHIVCSKNVSIPTFNGPILTITQIIKYVISSAAEAELASLYITAKICRTLPNLRRNGMASRTNLQFRLIRQQQ